MGVTLERVQNKFACIIGELCNEPDVLSQFAIWVDLRIAEYKSKGAISLDCSGENPNPTWLRGFRPPSKEAFPSPSISRQSHFSQRDSSLSPGHQRLWDQHSTPKYRSSDNGPSDVFHRGEVSRKRPAPDLNSSYPSNTDNSISSSKSQRLNPSQLTDFSQSIIEPTNESLMSIIGADQEPEVIETKVKAARENIDSSEITIVLDSEEPDHDTAQSTASRDIRGGHSSQTSDATLWAELVGSQQTSYTDNSSNLQGTYNVYLQDNMSSKELSSRISRRISPNPPKSQQTTKNLVSAVSTLERWLRQSRGDTREVEMIPPEELDGLLCDFFSMIKLPSGLDYSAEGLKNIRCSLARFLEEANYPHRITKSTMFMKSQSAFRVEYKLKANKLQFKTKNIGKELLNILS